MANIRPLSPDELKYFADNYSFELINDYILVKIHGRVTPRNINSGFTLKNSFRKLTITKDTIDLWLNNFIDYSLIKVQQAISILKLTYQEVSIDNILTQLNKL